MGGSGKRAMTVEMGESEDRPERLMIGAEHNCFGCGALNTAGLGLQFFADLGGNGVWTPFTPAPRFEGYTGVVHGGIVSAVLDEVMAWSLYRHEIWAVTADLVVRFRHPVVVGEATRAVGRTIADRGRVLDLAADLRRDGDGLLLASATASFVRVPDEQADAWRDRYLTGRT